MPERVTDLTATLAGEIEAALRALGTPERAGHERRYLKSEREHVGVTVPAGRRALHEVLKAHPDLDRPVLLALVATLWRSEVHELCQIAADLLAARTALLEPGDIEVIEHLLREARTWALVDTLAPSVAGPLVQRYPALEATPDRWAADGDFWMRRAALLTGLLPLRRPGPAFELAWARFARYADTMLDEREFFIRKAIGWVLREAAKADPDRVAAWLAPRTDRASGVTMREAVKRLPAKQAEALMAAYHERRPLT